MGSMFGIWFVSPFSDGHVASQCIWDCAGTNRNSLNFFWVEAISVMLGIGLRLFPLDNVEILIIRTICWFNHWQGTFLGYNY